MMEGLDLEKQQLDEAFISKGESEHKKAVPNGHLMQHEKIAVPNGQTVYSGCEELITPGVQVTRKIAKNTHHRVTCILVGVALLLSLITLILTIVVYVEKSSEDRVKQTPLEIKGEICLPCIQLVHNPYHPHQADPVLEQLTKKLTNGKQMCCAEKNEQLSVLLEAVLRKQQLELPSGVKTDDIAITPSPSPAHPVEETSLKFVPASAHKKLYPAEDVAVDEQGKQHALLGLIPDIRDPLVEHLRNISVDDKDSALVIEFTGLYHIYLNIHFEVKCDTFGKTDSRNMFWYIHRTSPNSPANSGVLIQTSHTVPESCTNGDQSLHAGGVFYLKAGDKLQVCSTPEMAGQIGEASFLGLAMLASGQPQDQTSPQ